MARLSSTGLKDRGRAERVALNLLYQGEVTESLRLTEKVKPSDLRTHVRIAGLCQVGRLEEAFGLWKILSDQLDSAERARSQFHMVVGLCRRSRFRTARKMARQLWLLREEKSEIVIAYAYQAHAFLAFSLGNPKRSLQLARRAYRLGVRVEDSYLNLLAMDLVGHSQYRLGLRGPGQSSLEVAQKLAEVCSNHGASRAIQISRLLIDAELGYRPQTILDELRVGRENLKVEDTYSYSLLQLEEARQLNVRGLWHTAEELLNLSAPSIYKNGNKRLEFLLQLRLCETAYNRGDHLGGLHFLQNAWNCSRLISDPWLTAAAFGLQFKFSKVNPTAFSGEQALLELKALGATQARTKQFLFLRGYSERGFSRPGEDKIFDSLTECQRDLQKGLKKLEEKGWSGLWVFAQGYSPGRSQIFFDSPGRSILASPWGVKVSSRVLSARLKRFLLSLARTDGTRKSIYEWVWGHTYDRQRHDHLMNVTVDDLRKELRSFGNDFIVTTSNGWRFGTDTHIQMPGDSARTDSDSPPKEAELASNARQWEAQGPYLNWNFRQLQFLDWLRQRQKKRSAETWYFSIQDYKAEFEVSTMTAFRDIREMALAGALDVKGRGRATRYCLKS